MFSAQLHSLLCREEKYPWCLVLKKLKHRRVCLPCCSRGSALIPPSCTALPWLSCPVETKIREKQADTCSPGTVILTLAVVSSWCKA